MKRNRLAFSLMELLLALAISGIVLMLLAMAIDMQWRLFDARRTGVEEMLIGRSVINRIATDLRGAILHTPPDLEGLDAITNNPLAQAAGLTGGTATGGTTGTGAGTGTGNNQAGQGQGNGTGQTTGGAATTPNNQTQTNGTGGNQPGTGGGGAAGSTNNATKKSSGTGASGGTTTGAAGSTAANTGAATTEEGAATQAAPVAIVGVYGAKDWLSIDVSRLPRIDEYQAVVAGGTDVTPIDIPSDVKTISYYIATPPVDDPTGQSLNPVGEAGAPPVLKGLVRQQMSRAITSFNEQGGGPADQLSNAEVLAEEVNAIELAYFDGTTWFSEWNSTEAGGIPVAVAIAIQVEMPRSRAGRRMSEFMGEDPDTATQASIHRMVIHLPAAQKFPPPVVEETVPEDAAAGGTGGTTGSTMP